MKFTCQKSELVKTLQIISKAFTPNPQTPILSGIYIKCLEKENIELRSTDHEIGIIAQLPADIEEMGEVIVSGKYFQDIVRSMPGETISLNASYESRIVKITSGAASFDIMSMKGEYPLIKMSDATVNIKIKNDRLSELIQKTSFACSRDEKRPVFTGCLIELDNDKITMAATNTHRLAVQHEELTAGDGVHHYIIPSKYLPEVSNIFATEVPEDITLSFSDSRVCFHNEKVQITLRFIEGNFPDYKRVIPNKFATVIRLKTEDFKRAVERVSLIARHDDYKIMRFVFKDNKVKISSNNPLIGCAEETMMAEIEGPEVNIAFNFTYMADVLKNIVTPVFNLSLNMPLMPGLIEEPENDTYTYIITPVKTKH